MKTKFAIGDWIKVQTVASKSYGTYYVGKFLSIDYEINVVRLQLPNDKLYELVAIEIQLATDDEIMLYLLES